MSAGLLRGRPAAVVAALALLAAGCRDGGTTASDGTQSLPTVDASLPDAGLRVVAAGDPNRLVVAPNQLCAAASEQVIVSCSVTKLGTETVGWLVVDGGPAGGRFRLFRGSDALLGEFLAADDPGGQWAGVQVAQAELTGDGVEELIVGFRNRGADAVLELAVISLDPGLVLRKRLPHGRAQLGGAPGSISAFTAERADGAYRNFRISVAVRDEAGGVETARFVSDYIGTLEAKDVPVSEL